MLGFTPFKRHPNKFNYIPRYYDPEKEAREQRRAELRGERAEDADREYQPGQYIRTQREARDARRSNEEERGRIRVLKMAAGAVLVLLFIYLLYPKLAELFLRARGKGIRTETTAGRGGGRSIPMRRLWSSRTITRSNGRWQTRSDYYPRSSPIRSPRVRWSIAPRRWSRR